jgi:hypothetical protein
MVLQAIKTSYLRWHLKLHYPVVSRATTCDLGTKDPSQLCHGLLTLFSWSMALRPYNPPMSPLESTHSILRGGRSRANSSHQPRQS